jgi:hypothetical protein
MARYFPEFHVSPSTTETPGAFHPHHGFDPNQRRVPAGHADGGQWTNKPGGGAPSVPRRDVTVDRSGKETWGSYVDTYRRDGSLAERHVFNRDGSHIVSEFNTPAAVRIGTSATQSS